MRPKHLPSSYLDEWFGDNGMEHDIWWLYYWWMVRDSSGINKYINKFREHHGL